MEFTNQKEDVCRKTFKHWHETVTSLWADDDNDDADD
jgi:hypothetical protein